MRKPFLLASLVTVLISSFALAAGGVLPGAGTEVDPYLIEDVNDFDTFADPANAATYWASGVHTKLMTDIDLAGRTYTTAVIAPSTSTEPWEFLGTVYAGIFDGNGLTIVNLTIDTEGANNFYLGLFGAVDSSGEIKNLGVENINILGTEMIGGLTALNWGTIIACYLNGEVDGESSVGGLVGENEGIISTCYVITKMSGDYTVGGLVGGNGGTISCCYAIPANEYSKAGLVGANNGNVLSCFWDMEINNSGSAGGKGLTTSQMKTMSIYQNAGWGNCDWVMNDGVDTPRLLWEPTGGISIPTPNPIPLLGSGTSVDPYQITLPSEFALLSWYSEALDKHFRLMENLDLSGITLYPIGDLGTFTGSFEGNNHTISNAVISQPQGYFVGLFGNLRTGGQIINLDITDTNIQGYSRVGGLVGNSQGGRISFCDVTGVINGNNYIGGLIGYITDGIVTSCHTNGTFDGQSSNIGGLIGYASSTHIEDCNSMGTVDGGSYSGGLVGSSNSCTIVLCSADNTVTGSSYVGGLVGYLRSGSILTSHATGDVVNTSGYVGGLVGGTSSYPDPLIEDCYATGNVQGYGSVGGLVGRHYDGEILTSYATGNVEGTSSYYSNAGGLVGENYSSISSCYATGNVTGNENSGGLVGNADHGSISYCYSTGQVTGANLIGGLVGNIFKFPFAGISDFYKGTVRSSFWDTETSSRIGSAAGKGLTTAQMKTKSIYENAGWDDKGWVMNEGDYPRLNWENTSGTPMGPAAPIPLLGDGTINNPYQVATAQDFACLSWYADVLTKRIKLVSDIDLTSIKIYPIGDLGPSIGRFDGNYHTIKNATINMPESDMVGLFSELWGIYNVDIQNVNIHGRYLVGSIAGYSRSSNRFICVTGTVEGDMYIGGLVGYGGYHNLTSFCYSHCQVNGSSYMAGLIGRYGGRQLTQCFSTGYVAGIGSNIGGLVGYSNGVESSNFWDINTSGQTTSAAGMGKTTAEMQMVSTFTNAGWDFLDESQYIYIEWRMCVDGVDYPHLFWEFTRNGDFICNNSVDLLDLQFLTDHWLLSYSADPDFSPVCDANRDYVIDLKDFLVLSQNWLE